jgi:hypothetical protein
LPSIVTLGAGAGCTTTGAVKGQRFLGKYSRCVVTNFRPSVFLRAGISFLCIVCDHDRLNKDQELLARLAILRPFERITEDGDAAEE